MYGRMAREVKYNYYSVVCKGFELPLILVSTGHSRTNPPWIVRDN
jgi:hypothetical protein